MSNVVRHVNARRPEPHAELREEGIPHEAISNSNFGNLLRVELTYDSGDQNAL
jgi:hypothetical protein